MTAVTANHRAVLTDPIIGSTKRAVVISVIALNADDTVNSVLTYVITGCSGSVLVPGNHISPTGGKIAIALDAISSGGPVEVAVSGTQHQQTDSM
jgi:hypothetical protein